MTEAIDRLGQTHFGIIPADLYKSLDNPHERTRRDWSGRSTDRWPRRRHLGRRQPLGGEGRGQARLDRRQDRWQVGERPFENSRGGLRQNRDATGSSDNCRHRRRLRGPVGSPVAVDFLDDEDRPIHKDLIALEPLGVPATFGNLPTFHVQFHSKRVDGTVGYVSLNIFFDLVNVLQQFGEAIEASRDTEGLIIDLRGNPGGIGAMAIAIGGWLVSQPGLKLGTVKTREASLNFALQPRRRSYKAPVAVLVDELSMSTSEILAGGLRDLKRVRIFGTKSPGRGTAVDHRAASQWRPISICLRQLHFDRRQASRRSRRLARRQHPDHPRGPARRP